MCLKAAKQINALKRLTNFLNFDSRMAIFRSFILSNFNYCSVVWHSCGAKMARTPASLKNSRSGLSDSSTATIPVPTMNFSKKLIYPLYTLAELNQ